MSTRVMDHCLMCGQHIDTDDCLIAIETHVSEQIGCSVEFRWVLSNSEQETYNGAFGSVKCAVNYFLHWMREHMEDGRKV